MYKLSEVAANPSGWDSRANYMGTPLDEFDNLYVVMARNRDSDLLTESNWDCAVKQLGGESDNVVIHRFGHWACGWLEYLCVTEAMREQGQAIADSLEDYPVLDETDYSEREWSAATDHWASLTIKERVRLCQGYRCKVLEARHDSIPQSDNGGLFDYLAGH